ncbi:MAG: zinc ribbon domain-containing protein [Candidatus Paceibacterota bacterium]|jgi:hypothetical protein
MFCENCGDKIKKEEKFCTKCGKSINLQEIKNERWWHRLLKVLYIIAYFPLIGIVSLTWSENFPHCYTYTYSTPDCYGSYGEAFLYSLLALVIYMTILRLAKIAVLYIVLGRRPEWGKEFKRFF